MEEHEKILLDQLQELLIQREKNLEDYLKNHFSKEELERHSENLTRIVSDTKSILAEIRLLLLKEGLETVRTVEEDGDWYVLPSYLTQEFEKDLEDYELLDSGKFDEKYGHYRTGGNLNLVQLYGKRNRT